MTTRSSWSPPVVEPSVFSTPMTVTFCPPTVMVWPTALVEPSSWAAVVEPSTATELSEVTSAAVKNLPCATERARTPSHSAFVATTLLVHVVVPATRLCEPPLVGATRAMSGATLGSASTAASSMVRVVALPRPPRTPEELVVLPGVTLSRLEPSLLIWSVTCFWAPWPNPTVSMTAAIPMRMPNIVSADRRRRVRRESYAVRRVSSQVTDVLLSAHPGCRRA